MQLPGEAVHNQQKNTQHPGETDHCRRLAEQAEGCAVHEGTVQKILWWGYSWLQRLYSQSGIQAWSIFNLTESTDT